ncbi:MAG: hypothetical protein JW718_07645 [Desulfovibrionaceae bacterium]|nr:hypothetical protein [Desulfovibrionaceae bacterium]
MGRLTEDMTRLCGEIVTLRGARGGFVRDLRQDVASLRVRFRRTEMAEKSKEERLSDLFELKKAVSAMKSGFRRSHARMARETQRGRRSFVADLKKRTAALLHEYALDLRGAHRAWFGPSQAELQALAAAERRAAEAHIKAEEERKALAAAERRAAEAHIKAEEERKALAAAERRTAEVHIKAEEERKARKKAEQPRAAKLQTEAETPAPLGPKPRSSGKKRR